MYNIVNEIIFQREHRRALQIFLVTTEPQAGVGRVCCRTPVGGTVGTSETPYSLGVLTHSLEGFLWHARLMTRIPG